MRYYLCIQSDAVVILDPSDVPTVLKSVTDYDLYLQAESKKYNTPVEDFLIMFSSTMDFPDDFTLDPKVIALAREIGMGRVFADVGMP